MVKIRNGGFERGDTEFWEIINGSELVADTSKKKRGSYSGKIKASSGGIFEIRHKDLIPVEYGDIIEFGGYVYPNDDGGGVLKAYFVDEDCNFVDVISESFSITGGQWNNIEAGFLVPTNSSYVLLQIGGVLVNANSYNWIDSVYINIFNARNLLFRNKLLYDSGSGTFSTSGNSSTQAKPLMGLRKYYAQMDVEWAGSDSDETIIIKIHDKSPITGMDEVVGVFTQVKAEDKHERIDLANVSGRQMYVEWVLGGTTPQWKNLKVEVWGVR